MTLAEHDVELFGTAYRMRCGRLQAVPPSVTALSDDAHTRLAGDARLRPRVRTANPQQSEENR